jgi:hypothetical protein
MGWLRCGQVHTACLLHSLQLDTGPQPRACPLLHTGTTSSGPPERRGGLSVAPCLPARHQSSARSERGRAARQVLFYCHFPDLLLVQRRSRLRALYRAPLNRIEEATTGAADRLLVNSNFTNGAPRAVPRPRRAPAAPAPAQGWAAGRDAAAAGSACGSTAAHQARPADL